MRGGGKAPLPPPPQYPNAVLDLLNKYAILNVTGFSIKLWNRHDGQYIYVGLHMISNKQWLYNARS